MKSFNIAQIGTFDCENFGDLLFPEVLRYNLGEKLNVENFILFSPIGGQMPFYPDITVYPISKLEEMHLKYHFDAMIIGGGDLIRLDPAVASSANYETNDSSFLWTLPVIVSQKYNIPLLWNAPGVPFTFSEEQYPLARFCAKHTDYLAVRDEKSKNLLDFCALDRISVVSDSVVSISRFIGFDKLMPVFERFGLQKGEYIIFQAHATGSEARLKETVGQLMTLSQKHGKQIVLMPIGYVHDDLVHLKSYLDAGEGFILIDKKLSPLEMIALIANADFFIGTSLHGNVISYTYGVNSIAYAFSSLTKIQGFFDNVGLEGRIFSDPREIGALYEKCIREGLTDKQRVIDSVDAHFSRMAEIIGSGAKNTEPETSAELVRFITDRFAAKQNDYCVIYFDRGSGFNESDTAIFPYSERKYDFCVNVPTDCVRLRFDCANEPCLLAAYGFEHDGRAVPHASYNGVKAGNMILFDTADPQMILELPQGTLHFYGEVISKANGKLFAEHMCGFAKALEDEIIKSEDEKNTVNRLWHGSETYYRAQQALFAQNAQNSGGTMKTKIKSLLRKIKKVLRFIKREGLKKSLIRVRNTLFRYSAAPESFVAITEKEAEAQRNTKFEKNIKFSVLVPLYNTPEELLKETLDSVINQTYSNWELCLADGSDGKHAYVGKLCLAYAQNDGRIKYEKLEQNAGISENTNACARMATGDYIALFDHDDLLMPNALFENAKAINECEPDVLYSDEDKITESGNHMLPFFKPDWSRDLLYSHMYICHLIVFKKELFEAIGGFRSEFDGSQDYDLMLRLSEKTDNIYHIPKILYSWRITEQSTAANPEAKPYAHTAGLRALDEHLKRRYPHAHAEENEYLFTYTARFDTLKNTPKISIVIPMKNHHELTNRCVMSILEKTTYKNYEILLLDNNSDDSYSLEWLSLIPQADSRIRVIKADFEFNWSKLNNFGIKNSDADVFVFLNNDTEVIAPDWLTLLAENAMRDDIGVAGSLLLYEDHTIQHAGVIVGMGGWADHVFKGMPTEHFPSPFVSPMVARNVLAVTGACMAISRKTLGKIGLFDEEFIICGSDVEICLRAYQSGLRNIYLPASRLYHMESKSRDPFIPEKDFQKSAEAYAPYRLENHDPYYNINLNINSCKPERI